MEGAIHHPIKQSFASLNASVELADSLIADFHHHHNLNVGQMNKTGLLYLGHYDPWLDYEISSIQGDICWKSKPAIGAILMCTDPLKFPPTEEQFGITKIPATVWLQCDFSGPEIIEPSIDSDDSPWNISPVYPAQLCFSKLKGK